MKTDYKHRKLFTIFYIAILTAIIEQSLFAQSKAGCGPVKEINKQKIIANKMSKHGKNILKTELQIAGTSPITGFYRDGYCSTGADDMGVHVVAAVLTDEFLQFSKAQGNDLITPNPLYGFPGLKAGDKWCLCAARWKEAFKAGVAPPVLLEATHEKALEFVTLEEIKSVNVRSLKQ